MDQANIRNFCIIAHIDHGKSTLADRFLELTNALPRRKMHSQILDTMDLEQERGITIKLQPARMNYIVGDDKYELNLIDTPGHVDFSYEVSRSIAAVEGAILLVDATKGVQAQTLANLHIAQKYNLKIIPAVNKIDLAEARPEDVAIEIAEILQIDPDEVQFISAKTGQGVKKLLEKVIKEVPSPSGDSGQSLQALIFDSFFDEFRGIIIFVRIFQGRLKTGEKIKFISQNAVSEAVEVGSIMLGLDKLDEINCGEIGYIVTSLKQISDARVGDTITGLGQNREAKALPGYEEPKPMVFAEFYTSAGEQYNRLREALSKLSLNDSSLYFEPTNSRAFGFGFKIGFLGMLHLEIIKERLEREFSLELVVTTPTVDYKREGEDWSEPWVSLEIITPKQYLGKLLEFVPGRRGEQKDIQHLIDRIVIIYEIPLSEIIIDFYDKIKSLTCGYGSINYHLIGWRKTDLVKLEFIIADEPVDAFNRYVFREFAQRSARKMVERMKEVIPRQNFEVKIQAVLYEGKGMASTGEGRIIASERISPFRKNVTEKLYGGDVTRKRKLLEKQKKGKKKMAQIGKVEVPTDIFVKLLKMSSN